MSFWAKLRTWWLLKKSAGRDSAAKRVYIVDAGFLGSSNEGRGRLPPHAQIDILRRLSRFATKENIQTYVVFEGKPLNKVPEGGSFDDLVVHYGRTPEAIADIVIRLLKEAARRKEVTVVTSDRQLEERVLVNRATTLRTSTFRKVMESAVGGGGGGGRGDDRRFSRGGRRRRRRRGPREGGYDDQRPRQDSRRDTRSEPNGVNDLIDVVESVPRRRPEPQAQPQPVAAAPAPAPVESRQETVAAPPPAANGV